MQARFLSLKILQSFLFSCKNLNLNKLNRKYSKYSITREAQGLRIGGYLLP